ncbi:hypothetical protein ACIOEZ_03255 [Streptomyces sp. NPDC087866]|uniref:hypothetical protein n=1 Tax=unclassified Streptomyces TaxID=2593676 RepID=UPI00224D2774|nr:hypothetical protein [Streptomyces sp. NBC_01789]MCX4447209.1 hypothetical protein [Streptomyces sp. NBC_01789]
MAITRRPLLTAIAAGTLLCALWFVPSANATGDTGTAPGRAGSGATTAGDGADRAAAHAGGPGGDSTPYVLGGAAFLGIGAGFVTYSPRRTGPRAAV